MDSAAARAITPGVGVAGGTGSLGSDTEPTMNRMIRRASAGKPITWPHEYVVVRRGGQKALLAAFCARIARGEGVDCRFFGQTRRYLFLGNHKYWTMTDCAHIDLDADDYVLNRARLYRDRRDFDVRPGDRGAPVE